MQVAEEAPATTPDLGEDDDKVQTPRGLLCKERHVEMPWPGASSIQMPGRNPLCGKIEHIVVAADRYLRSYKAVLSGMNSEERKAALSDHRVAKLQQAAVAVEGLDVPGVKHSFSPESATPSGQASGGHSALDNASVSDLQSIPEEKSVATSSKQCAQGRAFSPLHVQSEIIGPHGGFRSYYPVDLSDDDDR